jgi:hypothetical protein
MNTMSGGRYVIVTVEDDEARLDLDRALPHARSPIDRSLMLAAFGAC